MNPVSLLIHLVLIGRYDVTEARNLVARRFDLTYGQVEQELLDARRDADALLEDTAPIMEALGA